MGLFTGKKGLVLGVVNDYSIAWAISQKLLAEGAEVGFTHLPGEKMERRVRKLAEPDRCQADHPLRRPGRRRHRPRLPRGRRDLRLARLRPPLDRLRPARRPEVPVRQRQPERLQDGDGHLGLLAGRRRPGGRQGHARGRRDRHADLLRRREGRLGLQPDGRLQGRARRRGEVPRLRPRPEEDPGQRRLGRIRQDPRRLRRGRLGQARRALRGGLPPRAGPSTARRSARPGCSSSPTSPAGSPARSSTSTAATTSWAPPAAPSRPPARGRPESNPRGSPLNSAWTRQRMSCRRGSGSA